MYLKSIFIALFTTLLVACGGGGSGESGGTITPPLPGKTITGQVVKGPVEGATVNLYLLSDTGSKSLVATAKSVANGKFDFTVSLTSGMVYLLESSGGTYTDEVSKQATTLAYPLRAIFIAPSAPAKVTINPLSELVLMDIDKSILSDKWLASNVSSSLSKVALALGVDSTTGANYIDLASLNEAVAETATEPDLAFSFQINLFSGVVNEIKKRNSNATFKDAFKTYYSMTQETNNDDSIASIFAASLIRAVDSIPLFSTTGARGEILNAAGLPSDASLAVFSAAESSGSTSQVIPNFLYKILPDYNDIVIGTGEISKTIFNQRGALIAYNILSQTSKNNYSHIGYASVSDVQKIGDITIGKWNNGYYYDADYDGGGVEINETTLDVNTSKSLTKKIELDKSYLAYIPATNAPTCGLQILSLTASTKASNKTDSTAFATLEQPSKVSYLKTSTNLFIGYDLFFKNGNGVVSNIKSLGGINSPSVSITDGFFNLYIPYQKLNRILSIRGVQSGDKAKYSGFNFSLIDSNNIYSALTAIFTQENQQINCYTHAFSEGFYSPPSIKEAGSKHSITSNLYDLELLNLDFLSDGTPAQIFSYYSTGRVYERVGNNYVGAGIEVPPAPLKSTPKLFTYFKNMVTDYSPPPLPGAIFSFNLTNSTPSIVIAGETLISSEQKKYNSGTLTVYMNQYPVGTYNSYYSSCRLTLNNGELVYESSYLHKYGCSSSRDSSTGSIGGGISGESSNFAVINFSKPVYSNSSSFIEYTGLIFQK